jgi:hypothetical protein
LIPESHGRDFNVEWRSVQAKEFFLDLRDLGAKRDHAADTLINNELVIGMDEFHHGFSEDLVGPVGSDHGQSRRIGEHDLLAGMNQDTVREDVHEMAVTLLAFLKGFFGPDALGHVFRDENDQSLIRQPVGPDGDGFTLPFLRHDAQVFPFESGRSVAHGFLADPLLDLTPELRIRKNPFEKNVKPHQRVLRPPVNVRKPLGHDLAGAVRQRVDENPDREVLQDGFDELVALAQFLMDAFPVGDIAADADETHDLSPLPQERQLGRQQPLPRFSLADQEFLAVKHRLTGGQHPLVVRVKPLRDFRGKHVEIGFADRLLLGFQTHVQRVRPIGKGLARGGVLDVNGIRQGIQYRSQLPAFPVEGLLAPTAGGHVNGCKGTAHRGSLRIPEHGRIP